MASVTPWRSSIPSRPDGQDQAAIYRGRAAHLRTLAAAEAEPVLLREQLRDLARQYDAIARSVALRRETLDGMRREIARQQTVEQQAAHNSHYAVRNGKPTG